MSSVLRYTREPTPISKRFTVFPYYGISSTEYYFTVNGETLYRIESDFTGDNQWIVARDMGTETKINAIDPEIIEFWETNNSWSNIQVIRPGRARKFQALALPTGNIDASDNNGPAWNAGGYTDPDGDSVGNIYNRQNPGINDLLILGNSTTTTSNDYYQNLPYGTLYAVVDPVVIQYENSGSTYKRAVVNRVVPS
jgi:hypothetical protein